MTTSFDVEELKAILKSSEQDPSLLTSIRHTNLRQRCSPNAYFAFPGTKGSMISLPPLQKWPIQLGWSFSTWFFLDPKANAQPYLYNFKTGKSGLGYSAHFFNNCLVLTSIRVKGKGVQHCVAYEFPSHKWIHCAVTYHNKWRASEIKVYVNGQMTANIEMQWQVQTSEIFDKCFIGGSGSITKTERAGDLTNLSGQMSAMYLFNEGLSPNQICAIHRLGPSYMGQFKYSNESHVNLPSQISKTLYDEKLASSLFCLFTPVAVDSGTLCIQLAPFKSSTSASAPNYFLSAPHAALQGETKAVITQPVCSTLQSLGCSRALLPLLESYCKKGDSKACESLIGFLCDLLESSPHWFANEIVQSNGFVIVASSLAANSRPLLTEKLLDTFLNLTRTLMTTASSHGDSLLLKNLLDNILFNPSLWVYAEPDVQIKLYKYLSSEFLHGTRPSPKYAVAGSAGSTPYVAYSLASAGGGYVAQNYATNSTSSEEQPKSGSFEGSLIVADLLFGEMRRVSTVLQSLHSLKYYYWLVEEDDVKHKARNAKLRPGRQELVVIRAHILKFITELITRANTCPSDEIQGMLNYISACSQPENILDVMDTLSELISRQSAAIVLALDQKQAIRVLFTLVGAKDKRICVNSLRLLNLFLSRCSYKKKHDIMNPHNLFMLLCDRLRCHLPLSLDIYEALVDLMIEEHQPDRLLDDKRPRELSKKSIVNSAVVKVIATLIQEQRSVRSKDLRTLSVESSSSRVTDIRSVFINDLWNLIVNSRENRRIILQMSVWQHWLINLIGSTLEDSPLFKDQVLAVFRVLLYHAVRYEFGGWRVWIDTLAIIHAKVSYDEFCRQHEQNSPNNSMSELRSRKHEEESKDSAEDRKPSSGPSSAIKEAKKDEASPHQANEKAETEDAPKPMNVSSISEHIVNESRGIEIPEDSSDKSIEPANVDEPDVGSDTVDKEATTPDVNMNNESDSGKAETKTDEGSMDSVDLAPSRAYRQKAQTLEEPGEDDVTETAENETDRTNEVNEVSRQLSMTSIPLEDPPTLSDAEKEPELRDNGHVKDGRAELDRNGSSDSRRANDTPKAKASPVFRIPEFRWGNVLVKLLNDLIFSIECDLYHWRCSAKLANLDCAPFVPKTANQTATNQSATGSGSTANPATSTNETVENILHRPENQIYIINVVHLVSQLADNVVIAAGGLLPLLADATGGTRGSPSIAIEPASSTMTSEGLTLAQANSLLYRLVSMIDMVVFAASHINLGELESDKNTTNGGILRQCLRLTCTVTVKNCLVLRALANKIASMGIGGGEICLTAVEMPKDMFDAYMGCSLLSANGLFEQSALALEDTDLIANLEYSPHQNPNTSSMPPILPFQSSPIKDPNKLLQMIDIQRIQACIYHNNSPESRQSQFLALSSLYFISVLMVSKYRDIIEPKQKAPHKHAKAGSRHGSPAPSSSGPSESSPVAGESSAQTNNNEPAVSSIEAGLMNFGNMQPNCLNPQQPAATTNNLTNMLTTKLEVTLDTICPLLKSIMCDFCAFLSKTLIGSHGQDLVNKEADRTFKRADASPVEVVMLLCSQEWQNTLQKNAGLAFIELINEGRVLSAGMKDHIVRVAMEADFILSRLRADDVSKHDHFGLACSESISARLHEEILINSLISSAARRDHMLFRRFKEMMQEKDRGHYKLDIWEDDDRRKRRFVFDSWDDTKQILYSDKSREHDNRSPETNEQSVEKADTKRILELQKTIELGCIDDHCSPAGTVNPHGELGHDSDISNYDDEDDDDNQTTSQISDEGQQSRKPRQKSEHSDMKIKGKEANGSYLDKNRASNHESAGNNASLKDHHMTDDLEAQSSKETENIWDYEECASVSDFTGSVVFAAEASLVWSIYAIPGVLQISTSEVHFEPNQNIAEAIDSLRNEPSKSQQVDGGCDATDETFSQSLRCNQNDPSTEQISLRKIDLKALRYSDFLTCNGKILLSDIRAIFSRHYLLQPNALEIFMSQRTSVMFAFNDFEIVKRVVKYLPPVGVGIKYGIPQSRRASLMSPRQLFAASNMTQRWQKREIGNFQYLMFLNTISGRTLQDLNQYPVFPWILTDYESDKLDLNLPKNFRDLSKPIGALNNKRRKEFVERYQSWDNPKVPAFHYGTHYSTAAFTLNWLSRMRGTYNASYLALQDGKYEEKSRLFLSLGDSWVSSLSGGQQNVKELIPEFFYLPEIFHANLGLPEVELPPWAKSAEEFVRVHRIALESELVSCQLHQWIDLIFGFKQRGPEAINAVNTFYYLTYQGNVNLNMIQDASLRDAIETQIKHFGQTPSQLTTEPHPPRFSALHASPLMYSSRVDEVNKVVKFPFNNPVVHISSCINNYIAATAAGDTTNSIGTVAGSSATSSPSSILTITSNNQYQIHKWMPDDQSGHPFTIDPQLEGPAATNSAARRQLIDVEDICSGIQLKLSSSADDEAAEQQLQSLSNSAEEVQWQCAHYIVTLNGKYIIMGSFYDYSFRVFTTESGKLCQVIYGHRGPITCIAKSEGNASADFYIATGGQDCSLLIWTWNDRYAQVEGSGVSAVHNPLPKLSLCGHLSPVLSAMICSELGLIASGSRNLVLVHNITSGENLLNISIKLPDIMENTLREHRQLHTPDGSAAIQRPQVADKEKTILEASMLGEGSSKLASDKPSSASSGNESPSGDRLKEERLAQLKNLCHSDYYITNLQLARELAFIVCVALPPPPPCRKRSKSSGDYDSSGSPPALLLTFNLMGSLMDSTPISQSTASSPKLGDVCVMQLTRDGEHLVLNDSPVTIKIYKTFGLQPLYSYSTNDIPDALSEDHNRVRSLALLDRKYILVGLDNGKIIVYNCDFRNLQ